MLLAGEHMTEVVLEVGAMRPERVVQPRDALRVRTREFRREEGVADVLPHIALVSQFDHLLRSIHRDAARHGAVIAELSGTGGGEDERADPLRLLEGHPL